MQNTRNALSRFMHWFAIGNDASPLSVLETRNMSH